MLSLANFRILYPEFESASNAFIQAHLDQQEPYLEAKVLRGHLDEVHGLRTAHAMALSPHGVAAKMASAKGETTYGQRLSELESILGYGYRTT